MNTESHHFLLELWEVKKEKLDNMEWVEKTLLDCVSRGGGTILGWKFHKFEPQGVSGVVLISESHVSIHTWPEMGYGAMDVFTCGDKRIGDKIVEELVNFFEPKRYDVKYINRGV